MNLPLTGRVSGMDSVVRYNSFIDGGATTRDQ